MIFVLISPSGLAKYNLESAISRAQHNGKQLNTFELHRVLLSTLKGNWRLYIRALEEALEEALKVQVFPKLKALRELEIDILLVRPCDAGRRPKFGATDVTTFRPRPEFPRSTKN
jgi:hypothetical protein